VVVAAQLYVPHLPAQPVVPVAAASPVALAQQALAEEEREAAKVAVDQDD
jgi:hypothetical protein